MKRNKFIPALVRLSELLFKILPIFFWGFLIFGFDEPYIAVITIISALIHECGHIFYILIRKGRSLSIRGVAWGFRIRKEAMLSYNEEITLYLSGPLANIIAFVCLSFLAPVLSDRLWLFAIINLATALSNLLPIEGYDGYGAILAALNKRDTSGKYALALRNLSSALTFLFCIFSLYLIDRHNGGYWIFAIFFISMLERIKKGVCEP